METRSRDPGIDWLSRILALLSLVVAIGAVGYLITQDQIAKTEAELVKRFDERLQEQTTDFKDKRDNLQADFQAALDRNDARMKEWNGQLVGALETFGSDARVLLTEIQRERDIAQQQRQRALAEQTDESQVAETSADDPDEDTLSLTGPGNQGQPEPGASREPESDTADEVSPPADAIASLSLASTSLRPTEETQTVIVIQNKGTQDAVVRRIRFRPASDFQSDSVEALKLLPEHENLTTIAFDSSDNTSKKPGHHGIYDRTFQEPLRIPANSTFPLRVLIDNPQHAGWGLLGQLVIDYNGQPLHVEQARVQFRGLEGT